MRTLVTIGLLPGVIVIWSSLRLFGLTEPVWPIWHGIAPLHLILWGGLLAVGLIIYAVRRYRAARPAG